VSADICTFVRQVTGAKTAVKRQAIQRLWSGYGEIARYALTGGVYDSVVVKHVQLPEGKAVGDLSHQRKVRSYQVETVWYDRWAGRCNGVCRVAHGLACADYGGEVVMVLEDLDAAGYSRRRRRVSECDIVTCLRWLAEFHANFLGEAPEGLWPIGSYWHLDTRPDEWLVLDDPPLKRAAAAIDRALKASPYQTLIHGDAKLDNFCFADHGVGVAAVDFQYVGGGPGIKDVAYFIDSCLPPAECERRETELLDVYFAELRRSLHTHGKTAKAEALIADWRALYPVAWTDFHRFLKGWSPGHWPRDSYSERTASRVIRQLMPEAGHGSSRE